MASRPRHAVRARALPRLVAVLLTVLLAVLVISVRAEDDADSDVAAALGFGEDGGGVDAPPAHDEDPGSVDSGILDGADGETSATDEDDGSQELRRRLDDLERSLYLGPVERRDVTGALAGMFELAETAPSIEEVLEVTGRGVGGAERLAKDATVDLERARDAIRACVKLAYADFNGGKATAELDAEMYLQLDRVPGDTSRVNIVFKFDRAEFAGVGYVGRFITRSIGLPGSEPKPGDPEEPSRELNDHIADAKKAITDAVRSAINAHKASVERDTVERHTPARWGPVADALFILAAVAEAGLVPSAAWPRDLLAGDGVITRSSAQWSRDALALASEMGSREATVALGDRVLFGRGGFPETANGPDCAASLAHLRRVADDVAKDAEAAGDFVLPREPGRLRDRERDAGWVSDEEVEDGDAQIMMEEDMAARGVPEAQRHVGYRRLLGHGVDRDEAAAARNFEAAANQGDPLAQFNLGYMHMRGISIPQNFTEAKRRFESAAAKDLPAAHNGLGVLAFNGQGTVKNLTAAREHFERGADAGDPDSQFNLASMFSQGLEVVANETKALELYAGANEAGHWRAPLAIAIAYQEGKGTTPDCHIAAHYFRVFIDERSGWTAEQEDAMRVLDGGESVETEEETRDPETGELITGESSVTTAPPDPWQALVRYAILAEQGCEAAASNAGWLLGKKMAGFRGEYFDADHAALAIAMLERSAAMGNHESHVDMGNARWERVVSAGGPGGGTQSRPSGNEPAMTPAFDCERCGQFGTLGWLAPRGWIDDEDAEDKRGLGLRRVRVGRHTRPPAGLAPEEEVAWHYAQASAAGVAEGTVSLAWAHVHGVGVPRNLTAASHMLSHAMHNAVDDEESVPAFFAWVGVEALQFAERWFLRPGALRGFYERSGWDSKRGERGQSRDHAGLGGGGHPVDDADEDAPGIGAEPGRKPSSPRAGLNDDLWFPFSWRVIENCLLLCLGALCLVVMYARRVLNDPGFDRDIVEQMPVGALAGVGAAIAVAAGVSVAVFGA